MSNTNSNLQKCISTVDEAISKFIKQSDNFDITFNNFKKHKSNTSIPKKESKLINSK